MTFTLQKQINQRIRQLGGGTNSEQNQTLQEAIESISSLHPLFFQDWDFYGVDKFFAENKDLYLENSTEFYDRLVLQYFSNYEIPYGQLFWKGTVFTPMTKGTADYEEFTSCGYLNECDFSKVRSLVGDGELSFMLLMNGYSYPDHFYICLQDPKPKNPTVFGTDREVFFREIEKYGSLSDFLQKFCSRKDFLKIVMEYIDRNCV